MVRGGKREGAGRPKAEPTKLVRVPERAAEGVRSVSEYFLTLAEEAFADHFATTIRANGYTPVVRLLGIEQVRAKSMIGGYATVPAIVATGEMGGIRATFEIGLNGSTLIVRSEEEI